MYSCTVPDNRLSIRGALAPILSTDHKTRARQPSLLQHPLNLWTKLYCSSPASPHALYIVVTLGHTLVVNTTILSPDICAQTCRCPHNCPHFRVDIPLNRKPVAFFFFFQYCNLNRMCVCFNWRFLITPKI